MYISRELPSSVTNKALYIPKYIRLILITALFLNNLNKKFIKYYTDVS